MIGGPHDNFLCIHDGFWMSSTGGRSTRTNVVNRPAPSVSAAAAPPSSSKVMRRRGLMRLVRSSHSPPAKAGKAQASRPSRLPVRRLIQPVM